MGNDLLKCIGTAVLVSAMGVGIIRGCQNSYDQGKPRVIYYVRGKQVIQRVFNSNEELQDYQSSERGTKEKDYYSKLNEMDKDEKH
jgi:hypothetical protein